MNLRDILTVSAILFAVIDVVGSIPVLLDVKRKAGRIKSAQATFVSLLIMVGFLFLGETILDFIGSYCTHFVVVRNDSALADHLHSYHSDSSCIAASIPFDSMDMCHISDSTTF